MHEMMEWTLDNIHIPCHHSIYQCLSDYLMIFIILSVKSNHKFSSTVSDSLDKQTFNVMQNSKHFTIELAKWQTIVSLLFILRMKRVLVLNVLHISNEFLVHIIRNAMHGMFALFFSLCFSDSKNANKCAYT